MRLPTSCRTGICAVPRGTRRHCTAWAWPSPRSARWPEWRADSEFRSLSPRCSRHASVGIVRPGRSTRRHALDRDEHGAAVEERQAEVEVVAREILVRAESPATSSSAKLDLLSDCRLATEKLGRHHHAGRGSGWSHSDPESWRGSRPVGGVPWQFGSALSVKYRAVASPSR